MKLSLCLCHKYKEALEPQRVIFPFHVLRLYLPFPVRIHIQRSTDRGYHTPADPREHGRRGSGFVPRQEVTYACEHSTNLICVVLGVMTMCSLVSQI